MSPTLTLGSNSLNLEKKVHHFSEKESLVVSRMSSKVKSLLQGISQKNRGFIVPDDIIIMVKCKLWLVEYLGQGHKLKDVYRLLDAVKTKTWRTRRRLLPSRRPNEKTVDEVHAIFDALVRDLINGAPHPHKVAGTG